MVLSEEICQYLNFLKTIQHMPACKTDIKPNNNFYDDDDDECCEA